MIKKYRKENSYSYTLGITVTFELLLKKPDTVIKVYIHPMLKKDVTYIKLTQLCHLHNIPYLENEKIFNILSDKENCYVIGLFNKYDNVLLEDKNHLVLVNPSDAGNLGTILRSSAGFNILDVAIIAPAVDIFNPKAVRSSMGALFTIRFHYFNSFDEYKNHFKNHCFYPFMLKAKTLLNEINDEKKANYSLIFGNEATGLDDSFLCIGRPIIIKHSNNIDSLNLPIAVSIALYEFTKIDDINKK